MMTIRQLRKRRQAMHGYSDTVSGRTKRYRVYPSGKLIKTFRWWMTVSGTHEVTWRRVYPY